MSEFNPASGTGNGFVFEPYRAEDLASALERMVNVFRNPPTWRKLVANAFACDFSWDRAARNYIDWFERLRRERAAA